jgi:DNA-directed RNA polymerase specialized sigma subunit
MLDFVSVWQRARDGDTLAREQVYGQVYTEARRLAQALWATDTELRPDQCRRLIDKLGERLSGDAALEETLEFIAYGASVLRGVIADLAQTRRELKKRREFGEIVLRSSLLEPHETTDVEILDHLIDQLQDLDPLARMIAELRLYADLDLTEIAEAVRQQPEIVEQRWNEARTLLVDALDG